MGSRQTLLISLFEWNVVSRHNYLVCVVHNMLTRKMWQKTKFWEVTLLLDCIGINSTSITSSAVVQY